MAKPKRERGVHTAVVLPAEMLELLRKSERGVSEEIRRRLALTFKDDEADPETRKLCAAIENFAVLVRLQTRHDWHRHAAANRVLRYMITARLARLKPSGEESFEPGELPAALLVGSEDPQTMGLGLEAIDFHAAPISEEKQRELHEKTLQEIRELHPQLKDDKS